MNGDQTAYALYSLLALVFVASSFAIRRLPLKSMIKMALGWLVIFILLFFAVETFQSLFDIGIGETGNVENSNDLI